MESQSSATPLPAEVPLTPEKKSYLTTGDHLMREQKKILEKETSPLKKNNFLKEKCLLKEN